MLDMLQDSALKLWVTSHMGYNSQRLLRNIGPNGCWKILNPLPIIPKWNMGLIDKRKMILTKDPSEALAFGLTGSPLATLNSKVLAMVAESAVIGLCGNKAQEISPDTSHYLYITLDTMATPERRIKEMLQGLISAGLGKVDICTDLNSFEKPSDGFGEGECSHVVHLHGDSAAITAVMWIRLHIIRFEEYAFSSSHM